MTVGSYLPAVALASAIGPVAIRGWSPWIEGLGIAVLLGYLLIIDVMLPLGRSKISICIDLSHALMDKLQRDDAWYLRVLVILAVVIAGQIAVDLIIHN